MATLAQLVVKISGDTGALEAALGRAEAKASSTAGGIGKAFSTIGKISAVGAAAGLAALTAAAVSFTGEAREAVKIEKQLDTVLKSTGGVAGVTAKAAIDYADAMQRVTNFDDEAVLSAENVLLTFTKVGKQAFEPAIESALNMSTALGTDLQSAVVMVGKALNDPVKGITAMTKAGIQFTDQQKKQIAALAESGDLLGAQKIILAELETQFGGSARAAADPWIQAKNQIGEVKEMLGKALLPTVTRLSATFRDFLIAHQPQIDAFAAALGEELPKAVDKLADVAGSAFKAIEPLLSKLDSGDVLIIAAAIGGALVASMGALAVSMIVATVAAAGLAGVLTLGLAIAIPAIIAAVVLLVRNWDTIWPKLQDAPMALLNWLKTHWADVLVFVLTGPLGVIIKNWDAIFDAMPAPVQRAMNAVAGFVENMVNFALKGLNKLIDGLNKVISGYNKIPKLGDIPLIPKIGDVDFTNDVSGGASGRRLGHFDDQFQRAEEAAVSLGTGIGTGLTPAFDDASSAIDRLAGSAAAAAEQALTAAEGLQAVADAFAQWQLRQLNEAFMRSGLSEEEFRKRLQSPEAKFYAELLRSREADIFRKLLVGSFEHGGVVPRDGLAAVHAGEKITRASEASPGGGVVYLTVNASGEQSEASAERITRHVLRALRDEFALRSMSGPRLGPGSFSPR